MKILHTGDWHIGKRLNKFDLLDDQKHALDQMIGYIEDNNVDVVVISGDIYDTTQPSKEAQALVNETLRKINIDLKKCVLMISGNHDSPSRLAYASDWFRAMNVHIHTTFESVTTPVVIDDIHFYLVPYFDVLEARVYYDNEDIETHHDVYQHIVKDIEEVMDKSKTNIFIGHLFVRGGSESDSERQIFRGLQSEVSLSTFTSFDKVLLGHLHHPFAIQSKKCLYSGSLLKYSFSESHQPKGFNIIDTDNIETQTFIPITPLRDCHVFIGDYSEVISGNVESLLGIDKDREAFYKFELDGLSGILEPMSQIRQIYPNALELKQRKSPEEVTQSKVYAGDLSDELVFLEFMKTHLDADLEDKALELFSSYFGGELDETDSLNT